MLKHCFCLLCRSSSQHILNLIMIANGHQWYYIMDPMHAQTLFLLIVPLQFLTCTEHNHQWFYIIDSKHAQTLFLLIVPLQFPTYTEHNHELKWSQMILVSSWPAHNREIAIIEKNLLHIWYVFVPWCLWIRLKKRTHICSLRGRLKTIGTIVQKGVLFSLNLSNPLLSSHFIAPLFIPSCSEGLSMSSFSCVELLGPMGWLAGWLLMVVTVCVGILAPGYKLRVMIHD